MKSLRALLVPALLALLGFVFTAPAATAAEMDAGAKELAKIDGDWSDSAVRRDLDVMASYYAQDAVVYPQEDLVISGFAAVKKYWASGFNDPTFTISWKTVSAQVSKSGDLGYTTGTYGQSYKTADGKLVKEKGKYVTVWARDREGKWKVTQDIWNSDPK